MVDNSNKLSGAEEYVAAEIDLAAPLNPDQEKSLRDAFDEMDPEAFDSCDIGAKKISISYDPTRISKEHLFGLIKQAGGQLGHVESEGSPLL